VSPFPRYGHSLPPVPTQSGHLLIFGGLVRESVRNDLFALDCQDFSAVPVQATGEIPVPRVGHASALVRSVLLVWGGDTKNRIEDEQDEGIYLFNIRERTPIRRCFTRRDMLKAVDWRYRHTRMDPDHGSGRQAKRQIWTCCMHEWQYVLCLGWTGGWQIHERSMGFRFKHS
jgi:hypothetical protein